MRKLINILTESVEVFEAVSSEDVAKSLFSLIKSNDGNFKSEKQAKFLLSQMDNGYMEYQSTMSFGTSRAANPTTTWEFTCDNQGVVKVVKDLPAKGRQLYWERTKEHIDAKRSDREKKSSDYIKALNDEISSLTRYRDETFGPEIKRTTDAFDSFKGLQGTMPDDMFNKVLQLMKDGIIKSQADADEVTGRISKVQDKLDSLTSKQLT